MELGLVGETLILHGKRTVLQAPLSPDRLKEEDSGLSLTPAWSQNPCACPKQPLLGVEGIQGRLQPPRKNGMGLEANSPVKGGSGKITLSPQGAGDH